jgi:hypothetical protein
VQPARLASVQHEPSISAGHEPGLGPLERCLGYHRWSIENALNEYIRHASAVFAIPPGVTRGGAIGEQLFDQRF